MKLLITGASGFIGRYVVAEALRRGHAVRALVRPASRIDTIPALHGADVELVRIDLSMPSDLAAAVRGVDAVVHLAATKAGDRSVHARGTIDATRALLAAMTTAGVRRIVAVSSFAVYDYSNLPAGTLVDEESSVITEVSARDEYSRAKITQERIVREHAIQHGWDGAVVRPGTVFGAGNIWTARLGIKGGARRWVRVGSSALVPTTYVENCAEAIVLAAERAGNPLLTVNIVDNEQPTQSQYAEEALSRLSPRPSSITLPWFLVRSAGRIAHGVNAVIGGRESRLPGFLSPSRMDARFKNFRYTNKRLQELGWRQRFTLAEGLDRSVTASDQPSRTTAPSPQVVSRTS